jgi:LuxR family maltose regulon positive regulatory protein
LIYQIQGKSSEAWQMVEIIGQYDLEQRGSEETRTRSLRARLLLMQGDLEGACRWVDTLTDLPPDQPLFWLEEPQVTRVRVLIARGGDADLHLANQILDVLDEVTERTHNIRYRIEILVLRALALEAAEEYFRTELRTQGESSAGIAVLRQALDLSRTGDFIRVFVDLGKSMQAMLRRLAKQGYAVERINYILGAFQKYESILVEPMRSPSLDISTLPELLTPRELEILHLLCTPASIKEIALNLNISYETVRRHTANIYGKLGVNGRRTAVTRAEDLKILHH